MGIISIEQSNNLFWLGRYVERVYLTLRYLDQLYDTLLDADPKAYEIYCEDLNIPMVYSDPMQFASDYLFDKNNPDSVYSNLSRAYDNGIVLRNQISSAALSYLQMALDTLEVGKKNNAYALLNRQIIDYLLAFWGCIDEYLGSRSERNLIKSGRYLERLDMQLRLSAPWPEVEVTLGKLERRLEGARISYNKDDIAAIFNYARLGSDDKETYKKALEIANRLVDSN